MRTAALAALLVLAVTALPAASQGQDFDQVTIRTTRVAGSIFMLEGSGGNMAVSVGEDATFLIDDQFAPLTDKIVAAVAELTDRPVDFVINTHFHYDHTDGNENFGEAGALIVSHENSRRRMETEQLIELFDRRQEPYSSVGLPKVTFDRSVSFHLNGETIDVFHTGPAHTDGDAMVYFRGSNVVHAGDVFVRYGLPFIDQPNGGSIDGIIEAVDHLAELTDPETRFIPGHGALSTRDDLLAYREMLITIRDRVQAMIDAGSSFDEIVAADPTEGFAEEGIPVEDFIRIVYDSLLEGR